MYNGRLSMILVLRYLSTPIGIAAIQETCFAQASLLQAPEEAYDLLCN
jgi:hypothetical protein